MIKPHVVSRVDASEVHADPFPHLVIDDFLPPAAHAAVCAALPAFQALLPLSRSGASDLVDYRDRASLLLNPSTRSIVGPAILEVADALTAPEVQTRVATRLRRYDLLDTRTSRREVRLDCDRAGAHMGAHTDAPSKLITCIVYLRMPAAAADSGTRLLKPSADWRRSGGQHDYDHSTYTHEDEAEFATAKRIEFRPNRALIFARGSETFHSYGPIVAAAAPRYIFNVSVKRGDTHE